MSLRRMPAAPSGQPHGSRAGARGLTLAFLLLSDRPLRECLTALAEEAGTPAELVDRLDLDEDVVLECCRVLADCGLTERMGADSDGGR